MPAILEVDSRKGQKEAEMSEYIPRATDEYVSTLMTELPAVLLTGPRACGKTTTASQHVQSELRLDDSSQASAFAAAPDEVLKSYPKPTLVDEWQEIPESLSVIKRAIDVAANPNQYIITGSAKSPSLKGTWPLTGRATTVSMYPLTVGERFRSDVYRLFVDHLFGFSDWKTRADADASGLSDCLTLALEGGFPKVCDYSNQARDSWYQGYVYHLIHRDMPDLMDVRSPQAIERLLKMLATHTCTTVTMQSLAEAAGVAHQTLQAYLGLLEDLRIVGRLEPWWDNRAKRLQKAPKYYLTDTGLAGSLAQTDLVGLQRDGVLLGRILENFVLMQLLPLCANPTKPIAVRHLRDQNGDHEVDFVLENGAGQVVGVEVKAAGKVSATDAKHLKWMQHKFADRFVRGVVFYTGILTHPLEQDIWAMPISSLWS